MTCIVVHGYTPTTFIGSSQIFVVNRSTRVAVQVGAYKLPNDGTSYDLTQTFVHESDDESRICHIAS